MPPTYQFPIGATHLSHDSGWVPAIEQIAKHQGQNRAPLLLTASPTISPARFQIGATHLSNCAIGATHLSKGKQQRRARAPRLCVRSLTISPGNGEDFEAAARWETGTKPGARPLALACTNGTPHSRPFRSRPSEQGDRLDGALPLFAFVGQMAFEPRFRTVAELVVAGRQQSGGMTGKGQR